LLDLACVSFPWPRANDRMTGCVNSWYRTCWIGPHAGPLSRTQNNKHTHTHTHKVQQQLHQFVVSFFFFKGLEKLPVKVSPKSNSQAKQHKLLGHLFFGIHARTEISYMFQSIRRWLRRGKCILPPQPWGFSCGCFWIVCWQPCFTSSAPPVVLSTCGWLASLHAWPQLRERGLHASVGAPDPLRKLLSISGK